MDKRKILTVELVAESPIGSDYFYTTLELPANPAEIEDAMHKARFSNSPTQYRDIHIVDFPLYPILGVSRFDTASIEEYNMLAKALLNITEPYQEAVFKALVDTVYPSGKKDLIQVKDLYCITQHVNECGVASNVATDFQLGEFVIAQDLNDAIAEIRDDTILELLDLEEVGKLQRMKDRGVFVDNFYVITEGFSIPEDYKMPLSEEEPYSPIVVELGDYDVLNEPTKKIKCFLPMDEEMRENAVKELGVNSFDDTCITDIQSCIPGVDTHYLPGNVFDDLNNIAFMYTKLSAMEKITFKALCEAEKPGSLRAYYGVNDRLSEYQMSYYVPDEGNFFKEYLSHHLPIKMDKQWLSTLLTHEEGERLLKALGATKTSYGILPARGQDLYMLVPYDYDKSMPITQDDHEYEVIEVCGQTGLYVDNREDSMKVPDGCYRYDFREGDDGDIATLEKSVNVNFGGSLFVKEPIDIPEDGYIEMDEDSSPNFTGDAMTIAEFAETDLSQLNQGEGMGGIS